MRLFIDVIHDMFCNTVKFINLKGGHMVTPVNGRLFSSYINRAQGVVQGLLKESSGLEKSEGSENRNGGHKVSTYEEAKNVPAYLMDTGRNPRIGHPLACQETPGRIHHMDVECDGVPARVEVRDSNPVYIPAEQRTKEVIEDIMPSVVSLEMTGVEIDPETGRGQEMEWLGTGFRIADAALALAGYRVPIGKILIATNHHVADGANTMIMARFDGETYEGEVKVLIADEDMDIAILEVDDTGLGLKEAPIGSRDDISQGEFVLAFGQPFWLPFRVTSGIINNAFFDEEGVIQTDAAINPGNSGGPLVDLSSGNVVGINTFIYKGANTMGFAMPIWQQFATLREKWANKFWRWNASLG